MVHSDRHPVKFTNVKFVNMHGKNGDINHRYSVVVTIASVALRAFWTSMNFLSVNSEWITRFPEAQQPRKGTRKKTDKQIRMIII